MKSFISTSIRPQKNSGSIGTIVPGAPLLPASFAYGKEQLEIREILSTWKDTAPCTHGSGERYVHKHWYEVDTNLGRARIYFLRKAARSASPKTRWFLYSLELP